MSKFVISIVIIFAIAFDISGYSIENVGTIIWKNVILNKYVLPQYSINKEDLKEIYYGNLTYELTDIEIPKYEIEIQIGKISKDINIKEGFHEKNKEILQEMYLSKEEKENKTSILKYRWVYKIKDRNSKNHIAVAINDRCFLANLK